MRFMSSLKIIEHEKEYVLDVTAEVGLWNVWDFEHDISTHDYVDSKIIYEDPNSTVLLQKALVPIFKFLKSNMFITVIKVDEETTKSFGVGLLGILTVATIKVIPLEVEKTQFIMNYKIVLRGWQKVLSPLLSFLIKRWTEKSWREDLPLKFRRNEILKKNFKDFSGIQGADYKRGSFKLPLAKHKNAEIIKYLSKI